MPLSLPQTGTCRCGRTQIRITAPPLLTMACHCTGCQRMTSAPYSLTAAIPIPAFSVVSGTPVLGGTKKPDGAQHYFCPDCMSWMYTQPKGAPFVCARPTMFDDAGSWCIPFIETWTSEKIPWAQTPAERSFEGFPPGDEYQGLFAAYAAKMAAEEGNK